MPEVFSFLGRTFVLWQTNYESPAYVDQMGVAREGFRVLREVVVTVVDEKFVPGQGNLLQSISPYALKATTGDGEEFFNNWGSSSDSSRSLGDNWYTFKDKKYVHFENAYNLYNKHGLAFVTVEGERAIPQGIMICESHNYGFHPDDVATRKGCHECYLDTIRARTITA